MPFYPLFLKVLTYLQEATSQNNESTDPKMETTHNRWKPLIHSMNQAVGLIVMVYLCHQWSNYLQTLHENDMWFSNIKVLFLYCVVRILINLYYLFNRSWNVKFHFVPNKVCIIRITSTYFNPPVLAMVSLS